MVTTVLFQQKNISCRAIQNIAEFYFMEVELLEYSSVKIETVKLLEIREMNPRNEEENGEIRYKPTGPVCCTFSRKHFPKDVYIWGMPFGTKKYIIPVTMLHFFKRIHPDIM